MFGLHSSLLVLSATLVVSYATLFSSLTQDNIIFLAPGHDGYSASSLACKWFDLFLCCPAIYDLTVNSRFSFKPAVITFPNNAHDVSVIIQIAQKFNYSAVARSGGVCLQVFVF